MIYVQTMYGVDGEDSPGLEALLNLYQDSNPNVRLVCVIQQHRNPGESQSYKAVWDNEKAAS